MFENKYLKQLQGVQTSIKNHKTNFETLKMPEPDWRLRTGHLMQFFRTLSLNLTPNIKQLFVNEYSEDSKRFSEHCRSLGEYFFNISDYYTEYEKYQTELRELKEKECKLKEKLGIE